MNNNRKERWWLLEIEGGQDQWDANGTKTTSWTEGSKAHLGLNDK